jgi:hypothetical protein
MNYAPQGKPQPVVKPGEFRFAAIGLDHGHIYGQCNGLTEAGADLVAVYDPILPKLLPLSTAFPQVRVARSERDPARLDHPAGGRGGGAV